ncbi:39S ribosomal protein L46, mitochondrial [Exaiptasia diaphana]|uniref:Large ribosomal subunit protein mL46 n=1 Tax=Exaiptasia diaphana TaxID=2652724 RepID=A0A913XRZ8_EXADI|nr:39S ribosomal protein L46, mitochondrial [Exaiptasia diaphana]KXJ20025.1 39S ribosomal protein L46, mitochondrial [Exaiptasia diaphana]
MAAKFLIWRGSQILSNICTNPCVSSGLKGHVRIASILGNLSWSRCSLDVRRSYCTSTSFKTQEDLQPAENIYSAVCVERLPLITPDKTDLARKYEELQDQIELEKSALSEDEAQVRQVTERKKKLTERDEDENLEVAQFEEKRKEFHEEQEEEFRQFQPANRETEADRNNDLKSINRKLEQTLILLLKNKKSSWEMPLAAIQDKETLRQTAERMIKQACGTDINVKFISNAPAGVLKTASKNTRHLNRVFFYKACYVGGSIHLSEEYEDYVWVTRDEIKDFLKPDYCNTVLRFVR